MFFEEAVCVAMRICFDKKMNVYAGDCFKTNELAQPLLLRFMPLVRISDENLDVTWLKYCKKKCGKRDKINKS